MYVKHGEGGVFRPPRKKTLKLGIGLKCMLKAQFFMDSSMKKKIIPITLIVWVLERVEKSPIKW